MFYLAEKNLTDSFNFRAKIADQAGDNKTKRNKIMDPLKYISNFLRTLEMSLINCETNPSLTWWASFLMVSTNNANQGATFAINETKLYAPVITLSTQDNAKLRKLKSGFKRTMNWNKYTLKPELLKKMNIKLSIWTNFSRNK